VTAIHQRNRPFGFQSFMVKHQYKVMCVSLVVGIVLIGIYRLLITSWFFSRLSLLLAIISFVPAGLVVLTHLRSFGRLLWWDKSNVVLTTRRSPKVENIELVVLGVLASVILVFVIIVAFVFSQ
jgi:hypothetical protein